MQDADIGAILIQRKDLSRSVRPTTVIGGVKTAIGAFDHRQRDSASGCPDELKFCARIVWFKSKTRVVRRAVKQPVHAIDQVPLRIVGAVRGSCKLKLIKRLELLINVP